MYIAATRTLAKHFRASAIGVYSLAIDDNLLRSLASDDGPIKFAHSTGQRPSTV